MFKFKQFTVLQDQCGMKVSIDACIFGALIKAKPNEKVLDIGTGTGLLSLMMAQKSNSIKIDAVELDNDAAQQAQFNITSSPFKSQITVHQSDIHNFEKRGYDLIIVNPPFFSDSLSSPKAKTNLAKHQGSLNLKQLAALIKGKLKPNGRAAILLPLDQMRKLDQLLAKENLNPNLSLKIKHNRIKPPFREIQIFSHGARKLKNSELIIRKSDNVSYTEEFQALLRDYYIIF